MDTNCLAFLFTLCSLQVKAAYGRSLVDSSSEDTYGVKGGSPAVANQFPFQVLLEISSEYICGGSIVDARHVLTAAHCVTIDDATDAVSPKDVVLKAGMIRRTDADADTYRVVKIIVHPHYNSTFFTNDIAILRVDRNFPVNKAVSIVRMRTAPVKTNGEQSCIVSGWGFTEQKAVLQDNLQFAHVDIFERELCVKVYENNFKEGMICAGDLSKNKDACQGDSGGPLTCNGLLSGVVSVGKNCGEKGFPGIYTDVYYHKKWIEISTNATVSCGPHVLLMLIASLILYGLHHR